MADMPPPPPRRPRVVLDEDTWTKGLEAIIERQFFPEIQHLRALHDGLYDNGGAGTPLDCPSPAPLWGTTPRSPAHSSAGEWDDRVLSRELGRSGRMDDSLATPSTSYTRAPSVRIPPSLSLDEYCRRYTSEDNASFNELLEKANAKVRERRDRLYGRRTAPRLTAGTTATTTPCATDGYGTSNQPPAALISWKHNDRNALFYGPPDRAQAPAPALGEDGLAIAHRNTRLHDATGSAPAAQTPAGSVTSSPGPSSSSPSREDGSRFQHAKWNMAGPGDSARGYKFMPSPSPQPGVGLLPLMTWGNIEGTPVRLDSPGFTLKPASKREATAHALTASARSAMAHKARAYSGGGGVSKRGASPFNKRTPLSEAGKRLMRSVTPRRKSDNIFG